MRKQTDTGNEAAGKQSSTSIARNQQRDTGNQEDKAGFIILFNYTAVADLDKGTIYPSVHEEEFLHLHDDTGSTELPSSTAEVFFHYFISLHHIPS